MSAFNHWKKSQAKAESAPKPRTASEAWKAGEVRRNYDSYSKWNQGFIQAQSSGDTSGFIKPTLEQIENDMNGVNAEIARQSNKTPFSQPYIPVSQRFFEFAEDVSKAADEGYYGFARGSRWVTERIVAPFVGHRPDSLNPIDIAKWSDEIGEAPDLRHTIDPRNDIGLQSWRSLYMMPVGLIQIAGLGAAVAEEPWRTPELAKGAWDGLVESINVIDQGATGAEKWGRALNLAFLVAGALEGAGRVAGKGAKIRGRFEANSIAKELSIPKESAAKLVSETHTVLGEMAAEKGPVAKFATDFNEALFGSSSKGVREVLKERMPEAFEARPGVAAPEVRLRPEGAPDPTGRVMVDPLNDGIAPVTPEQITKELFNDLSMKGARRGRTGRASEAAIYDAESATIVTRAFNDLSSNNHELGHHLDTSYDLTSAYAKPRQRSPWDDELNAMWPGRQVPKSWTLSQRRAEGVAEFVRAYVLNPAEAQQRAPQFFDHFEAQVPVEVRQALTSAGEKTRRFAAQDAVEKVKSQIESRVEEPQNIFEKAQGKLETPTQFAQDVAARFERKRQERIASKPFDTDFVTWMRKHVTNDQAALIEAGEYVDAVIGRDAATKLPEQDVRLLGAKLRYLDSMLGAVLDEGIRTIDGELIIDPVSKKPLSVKTILEPLDGLAEFQDMLALGVSERMVAEANSAKLKTLDDVLELKQFANERRAAGEPELATQAFKESQKLIKELRLKNQRMSNAGGGLSDPISIHQKAIDLLESGDPQKLQRMKEALRRYRAFSDSLMDFAEANGLISPEHREAISAKSDSYFDLGRVVDEFADATGLSAEIAENRKTFVGAGEKGAFGKFKGSTRKIESPVINLMFNTRAILGMAERNGLLKALIEPIHDPSLSASQRNLLASVAEKVKAGESSPDNLNVLVAGEKQTYRMHPAIAEVFRGSGAMIADKWSASALAFFPRLLRDAVTFVPGFVVRNLIRDTGERLLKAKGGIKALKEPTDLIKAYRATPEEIATYDYFGGGLRRSEDGGHFKNFARIQNRALAKAKAEGLNAWSPSEVLRKYNDFRDKGERANRLVEYNRVFESTVDELTTRNASLPPGEQLSQARVTKNGHMAAADAARKLIDFAETGETTRFINRFLVPFTSAGLAGLKSSAKAFGRNPGHYLMKLAVTQGTLMVLEQSWNRSQNAQERYEELPSYIRDYFHVFYVPAIDGFARVPKPFLEGVVVSGIPRAATGDWDGWLGNLAQSVTPVAPDRALGGPPLTAVFNQLSANYDGFRDSSIIPSYEEGLALELRDTSRASRVGQGFQAVSGIDARKFDFAVKGLTGGTGDAILKLSDIGRPDKPFGVKESAALATGLVIDAADYSAKSVQQVNSWAKKSGAKSPLKSHLERVRNAEKSGDVEDIKSARGQLYEAAQGYVERIREGTSGLKGKRYWERIKAILGG